MSGYLSIKELNFKKIKHDHIIINFKKLNGEKKSLVFNDQRRFGHIDFHETSRIKKHFLIKNLGIDGLSKKEVLYSKVYTMIAFILASTLFTFIISLILGFSFSDYTELGIVFSEMEYFFAYAVKLFAFFSMCLFLGIWIKRAAFALGFLIVWQMIEGISFGLMKWKLSNIIPSLSAEQVFAFFPLNAMSNLIKEPFTRLSGVQNIANQVGESIDKDYGLDWGSVLIALLWAGIFLALTYRLLQKRDL